MRIGEDSLAVLEEEMVKDPECSKEHISQEDSKGGGDSTGRADG